MAKAPVKKRKKHTVILRRSGKPRPVHVCVGGGTVILATPVKNSFDCYVYTEVGDDIVVDGRKGKVTECVHHSGNQHTVTFKLD